MMQHRWIGKKALGLGLALALSCNALAMASTQAGIVNGENINVRKNNSTSASVVTTLNKGSQVKILTEEDGWYHVKTDGGEGFVRTDKVDVVQTGQLFSTTKSQVNLRAQANTSAKVLTTLKEGYRVTLKEIHGDWYKVEAEGKTGYIRSDLLKKEKEAETAKALPPTTDADKDDDLAEPADPTSSMVDDGFDENEEALEIYFEEQAQKQHDAEAGEAEMQQLLKKLGFFSGEVDGKFGPVSEAALRAFQRAYDLEVDGVVGTETLGVAREAQASGGNGSSAGKVLVSDNGVIMAEWFNYMKNYFPKYVALRCVDVQTGEEFHLRAFSSGNHADVEPPTKADTDKLFSINGNKWSWDPRPIWVYIDGKAYAAVINVKPHGPDTLPDNGMSGQICMHFLHSRNHNTGRENADMQAGILKAFELAAHAPAPGAKDALTPVGLPTE